jgi:hypothetical protein
MILFMVVLFVLFVPSVYILLCCWERAMWDQGDPETLKRVVPYEYVRKDSKILIL